MRAPSFAVHIPLVCFGMGLRWPNFTATFGGVFGLGFVIAGFTGS